MNILLKKQYFSRLSPWSMSLLSHFLPIPNGVCSLHILSIFFTRKAFKCGGNIWLKFFWQPLLLFQSLSSLNDQHCWEHSWLLFHWPQFLLWSGFILTPKTSKKSLNSLLIFFGSLSPLSFSLLPCQFLLNFAFPFGFHLEARPSLLLDFTGSI